MPEEDVSNEQAPQVRATLTDEAKVELDRACKVHGMTQTQIFSALVLWFCGEPHEGQQLVLGTLSDKFADEVAEGLVERLRNRGVRELDIVGSLKPKRGKYERKKKGEVTDEDGGPGRRAGKSAADAAARGRTPKGNRSKPS